jgi:hypothetical protein
MIKFQMHAPLDPDCPEVQAYHDRTDDDPLMIDSGCADEFLENFERKHRAECKRCQNFGAENIEVIDA